MDPAVKGITYLTLAVAILTNPDSWARYSSGDDPIRVFLPPGVEIRSCELRYFLVGAFGGYGGFVRPNVDASEFEIETVHDGDAVQSLKAILYCPGYHIETMVFDSLPDLAARRIQLHPKPLGTVRFRGLVRGLVTHNLQVLLVDVAYTPWWICELFRLPDCGLGGWTVASVEFSADGRFATTLPDLARDSVIGSFKNPGEFAFRIRDQKTGNWLYDLKAAPNNSPLGRIPVANRYQGEQMFDVELRR
jgi:hypothetical protein